MAGHLRTLLWPHLCVSNTTGVTLSIRLEGKAFRAIGSTIPDARLLRKQGMEGDGLKIDHKMEQAREYRYEE